MACRMRADGRKSSQMAEPLAMPHIRPAVLAVVSQTAMMTSSRATAATVTIPEKSPSCLRAATTPMIVACTAIVTRPTTVATTVGHGSSPNSSDAHQGALTTSRRTPGTVTRATPAITGEPGGGGGSSKRVLLTAHRSGHFLLQPEQQSAEGEVEAPEHRELGIPLCSEDARDRDQGEPAKNGRDRRGGSHAQQRSEHPDDAREAGHGCPPLSWKSSR